jgi:hypothetical protein
VAGARRLSYQRLSGARAKVQTFFGFFQKRTAFFLFEDV